MAEKEGPPWNSLSEEELDALGQSICGATRKLVQAVGGSPADWAAAMVMATEVAIGAACTTHQGDFERAEWARGFIEGCRLKMQERVASVAQSLASGSNAQGSDGN